MKKSLLILSFLVAGSASFVISPTIAGDCKPSINHHNHSYDSDEFRITRIEKLENDRVRLTWKNAPHKRGVLYVLYTYHLETPISEWFTGAIIQNPHQTSIVLNVEPGTTAEFFRLKFTPSR